MQTAPLIVTVKMNSETFDFFNDLRQKHFPPERNHLSAHITLFHHLPGERLEEIEDQLKITASRQYEFNLRFEDVGFIGRGSVARIESPELVSLRNKLANYWDDYLTPQDRQKFMPHITIQNKVPPDEAKAFFGQLKSFWQPRTGAAIALQLWHYKGGPWRLANEFDFYKIND